MPRRALQLPLMPEQWHWATFEKIAPPNCRRYYRIEIQQIPSGWAVITHRGRIGQTPRPMVELATSPEEARSIAQKRAHDRFLHGYALADAGQ